ncbi:MAG: M28 family peptidase [Acidobacteria bacterium]|nr:M28 family peptidase [Acidobacteriota bacterium]
MRRLLSAAAMLALLGAIGYAVEPNADTRRWWGHVQALSNDSLEGRDTGSEGHKKAATYVANQFERNGIVAAGERGYYQTVPIRSLRLNTTRSTAVLTRNGRMQPLRWFQQITIGASASLPTSFDGRLVFVGSDNGSQIDTAKAIVVRLNPERFVPGAPAQPAPPANAAAVIGIDNAAGVEPQRWPAQYSVAMALAGTPPATPPAGPPQFRFNPAMADVLLEASGHTYKELLELESQGRPIPSFALNSTLAVRLQFDSTNLESDNVIGILRGSDAALASEYVVISAHLDGYGFGEPWGSDRIYNGAFDDAAYVATLIDFAERLRESGTKLRRSVLFAVVTGEEKGLLGSRYYTQHLTVPKEQLVANINLDQLRPIFPLHTLTTLAVDDSTLGDTARRVAATMDIRIQPDPEPLRNLLRRSDHINFINIGVPAVGFIFGFQKGTADEVAYRLWYKDRYHTPLDDLMQPWVPEAAARFNEFFRRLVIDIADADRRPAWKAGSTLAPRTN